jgi:hypothetical protein
MKPETLPFEVGDEVRRWGPLSGWDNTSIFRVVSIGPKRIKLEYIEPSYWRGDSIYVDRVEVAYYPERWRKLGSFSNTEAKENSK